MLIYRVQHPQDGYGPFRSKAWDYLTPMDHHSYESAYDEFESIWMSETSEDKGRGDKAYPGPYSDGLEHFNEESDVFAVRSKKMLKHWFGVDSYIVDMLKRAGFEVAKYRVNEDIVRLGRSKKQVAFDRTYAEYLGSEPIDVLRQ